MAYMHYYVPTLSLSPSCRNTASRRSREMSQRVRSRRPPSSACSGSRATRLTSAPLYFPYIYCPSALQQSLLCAPLYCGTLCPSTAPLSILQHAPSLLCLSTACTHTPYTSLYATSPRTLPRVPHPLTNLTRLPPYTHAPPRIGGVAQGPHAHLQEDLCHASAVPPDRVSSM